MKPSSENSTRRLEGEYLRVFYKKLRMNITLHRSFTFCAFYPKLLVKFALLLAQAGFSQLAGELYNCHFCNLKVKIKKKKHIKLLI